jgi:uncharacterized protein (TIGR01777 family)
VAGGSGFLGRALVEALARDGHEMVILTRGSAPPPRSRAVAWRADGTTGAWASELAGAGGVVNLAGESIAERRWTAAQKARITESRILSTRSLVEAINLGASAPGVFVSGSAVGFYGPTGDEVVTEERGPGTDFLAEVCRQWEAEAMRTQGSTRTVCLRTGLVLARDGGALPRMLTPFRFGVGGPIGTGRQYWPWIHRGDWVELVRWILTSPAVAGAVNATAPAPETNAAFARALGRALGRPAIVPAPSAALRLLLGEMAGPLLLSGQRAVPAKAERLGFSFTYPRLDQALNAILG